MAEPIVECGAGTARAIGFGAAEERAFAALLPIALEEDLGTTGDVTSAALLSARARCRAAFVARARGVLAGVPIVARLMDHFELRTGWRPVLADGDHVNPGDVIARVEGQARSILAVERLALNFLGRLSGVATLTRQYVEAARAAGGHARILDTRKTTPGLRLLEKYAVRQGGGCNHRMGLYDAVLIKDNHLAWLASQAAGEEIHSAALKAARASAPAGSLVTIEVDTLEQLGRVLPHAPDVVLLDNFSPAQIREAAAVRDRLAPTVLLEASGGVNLHTVADFAAAGADRISVGALTHSAPALDVALDFELGGAEPAP